MTVDLMRCYVGYVHKFAASAHKKLYEGPDEYAPWLLITPDIV